MSGVSGVVRVRKSVFKLGQPGDDLEWYGKAVAILKGRPITDPTSWRYMAAVHGYPDPASADPFKAPGEATPPKAEQDTFWRQCQHQSWFFLPWHRGYLACFEEIVAAAVVLAGGPKGWALPYWNYSDPQAHARALPAAFLNQFDAEGRLNPLWLEDRSLTLPADLLPEAIVSLEALIHSPFAAAPNGGEPGFGGPITGFHHHSGLNGRLEHLPHNMIHDAVGGLMGDADTAALDPIFWLHHANVDRLWEVWKNRDPSVFKDPTIGSWLAGTSFELHDSAGRAVKFTPSQMQDTVKVRHGYRYDDTSDPIPKVPQLKAAAAALSVTASSSQPPELVAASEGPVALTEAPTTTRVPFNPTARQSATLRISAAARPVRAYLNLENVTGSRVGGSYEVYVDAPRPQAAADANFRPPLLAGHLSTFGVKQASSRDSAHGGSGITTVLEITPLIEQLHRERNWDGASLDVTFVPNRPKVERRGSRGLLNVGRISIYYS